MSYLVCGEEALVSLARQTAKVVIKVFMHAIATIIVTVTMLTLKLVGGDSSTAKKERGKKLIS